MGHSPWKQEVGSEAKPGEHCRHVDSQLTRVGGGNGGSGLGQAGGGSSC